MLNRMRNLKNFREAFIYEYLSRIGFSYIQYGSNSEKGWDIQANKNGKKYLFQVKTTSSFSKTRTISPIHPGWDKMFLLFLDRSFIPIGIWLVDNRKIKWKKDKNGKKELLQGKKMRKPKKQNTGSPILFDFAVDRFDSFKEKFPEIYSTKK